MVYITFSWIIFGLYALTGYLYWRAFLSKRSDDFLWARRLFSATLIAQSVFIIYFAFKFGRLPIATVNETFGTFVFLTAAIYWVLEKRLGEFSMGVLILPIFLILLAIGNLTFRGDEPIAEVLKDVKFGAHVLAMLLAYGAFAISFIASLLHKLLTREIQKHELGMFYSRLPSLPFFERISNAAIDIGMIFATIGLGLGVYFASQVWQGYLLSDPKFTAAFLTWLIYGIHAIGRRVSGFSGQRAATISLIGFSWLLFSYVIISMLFTKVHHFAQL